MSQLPKFFFSFIKNFFPISVLYMLFAYFYTNLCYFKITLKSFLDHLTVCNCFPVSFSSMFAGIQQISKIMSLSIFCKRNLSIMINYTSNRKIILKRLAKKLLPEKVDLTRKQGFAIPLKHWLKKGQCSSLLFCLEVYTLHT